LTLSNKGSRSIVVGDDEYRWTISATTTKGSIVLIAEHRKEKGQKIEVHIKSDINDFWLEIPHVEGLNLKVVKPNEVAMIISEAIAKGWKPREKGKLLVFDWDNSKLQIK
jgi:hypothetical protein